MSDARAIIDEQSRLEQRRQSFTTWWHQIAQRVLPAEAQFTTTTDEGSKRLERVFSAKPITDNERFAAVMDEMLTPRSQVWHIMAAPDEESGQSAAVKQYLERLNKLLFSMRYRPRANFAAQKHQGYLSVGAFGNSCLYIDDEVGKGPRYKQIPMREVVWAMNHQGQIDTLYRKFSLTRRQAEQRAAEEGWTLPTKITGEKNPEREFDFVHCVRPNLERIASREDYRGWAWSSTYVALDDKMIVHEGGYRAWPYAIGRYMLATGESYGRSPAMAAWPAILTLNEEKKTILRAGQREVEPPLLLTEDGALEPFNMRPGALNHGTLSDQGDPLVAPLKIGSNVPLGMELMSLEMADIEEAFLVSVFKILSEHPQMTATQVLEIVQLRATLLAPMMGRQHSEDLGPLIEREVDLLAHDSRFAWITEDMPDELRERGGDYKVEYRSPLARAMRAQDGVAIMRTLEVLPAAAAIDKNALLVIDVPGATRELAEINGMPAKFIRDADTVSQLIEQQAEADETAGALAVAPELSQAALNAAKADQLRRGA